MICIGTMGRGRRTNKIPKTLYGVHTCTYSSLIALDNPPPTHNSISLKSYDTYVYTLQRTNSLPLSKKKKKRKEKKKHTNCHVKISLFEACLRKSPRKKKKKKPSFFGFVIRTMYVQSFPKSFPKAGLVRFCLCMYF